MREGARGGWGKNVDVKINNIREGEKAKWIFVLEKYWKIEKWYGCEVGGGNEEKMQRERW